MNFIKFNKIVGLIAVIAVFAFAQNASAQSNSEQTVFAGDSLFSVELKNAEYSQSTRNINLDIDFRNNTEFFFDDIVYKLELYAGDALAEEGTLFAPLDLILVEGGKLSDAKSYESMQQKISYTVPENLETGNYFVRLVVLSENKPNFFDIAYTNNPLSIEGEGGYIGLLDGDVIVPFEIDERTVFDLLEGPPLPADANYAIIFSYEKNPTLVSYLENNPGNISLSYTTQNIVDEKSSDTKLIQSTDSESGLLFEFGNAESLVAGPNYIDFQLVDESGKQIGESMRSIWLVEGFYSRLTDLLVDTNYYQKGDTIDLQVQVIAYDTNKDQEEAAPLDGFIINVVATTVEGEEISFSHELETLSLDEENIVSNLGYVFEEDAHISKVELILIDSDGQVVNSVSRELDTTQRIIDGNEFVEDSLSIWVYAAVVAALLLVILIAIVIVRKRRGGSAGGDQMIVGMTIITFAFVSAFTIFAANDTAEGFVRCSDGGPCSPTNISLTLSGDTGEVGECPQTVPVSIQAYVSCANCTNGVWTTLKIFVDGSQVLAQGTNHAQANGENDHGTGYYVGPFSKNISLSESNSEVTYYGTAQANQGYNCDAKYVETSQRTVSCSTPDGSGDDTPGNGNNNPNNGNNNPGGGDDEFSVFCGLNSASSIPADGETEAEWFAFASNASNNGSVVYKWTSAIGIDKSTGSSNAFTYTTELSGTIDDLVVEARSGNDIATISCPDVAFVPDIGLEFNAASPFASLETNTCSMNWTVGTDANSCSIVSEDGTVIFSTDFTDGREGTEEVVPGTRYKMSCEAIDDQGELITVESEFIGCNRVGDLNET